METEGSSFKVKSVGRGAGNAKILNHFSEHVLSHDGDRSDRHSRMAKPLDIREAPVKVLHQRQIVLLREWRELLAVMLPPKLDSL
jgi:hypothetical protein